MKRDSPEITLQDRRPLHGCEASDPSLAGAPQRATPAGFDYHPAMESQGPVEIPTTGARAAPELKHATREALLHALYEAAEIEHNLMCTYLYAAFSLKSPDEGLSGAEADAVARWRREIMAVAIDEMSHLTAVWKHHLGARRGTARRAYQLPDGSRLPAGARRRETRPVQRGIAAALRLSRAPHGIERAGRRRFRTGAYVPARRVSRAAHSHTDRLLHGGGILQSPG